MNTYSGRHHLLIKHCASTDSPHRCNNVCASLNEGTEILWGDGKRWAIVKDDLSDGFAGIERWERPWIVVEPRRTGRWTHEKCATWLDQMWNVKKFGGDAGLEPGEAARFPSFETACAAFASVSMEGAL